MAPSLAGCRTVAPQHSDGSLMRPMTETRFCYPAIPAIAHYMRSHAMHSSVSAGLLMPRTDLSRIVFPITGQHSKATTAVFIPPALTQGAKPPADGVRLSRRLESTTRAPSRGYPPMEHPFCRLKTEWIPSSGSRTFHEGRHDNGGYLMGYGTQERLPRHNDEVSPERQKRRWQSPKPVSDILIAHSKVLFHSWHTHTKINGQHPRMLLFGFLGLSLKIGLVRRLKIGALFRRYDEIRNREADLPWRGRYGIVAK